MRHVIHCIRTLLVAPLLAGCHAHLWNRAEPTPQDAPLRARAAVPHDSAAALAPSDSARRRAAETVRAGSIRADGSRPSTGAAIIAVVAAVGILVFLISRATGDPVY